ncbi:hypothetical protein BKG86_00095 [Mycobacteroides chelonae]|nr:DUF3375 family protein [Mycobacteroides chelonae]OHU72508.1 hypothetical protein BKG86_00095 [Mycobacteroides chelonae]
MGDTLQELFVLNDALQKSRAVRLLAAKNLAPYITLMERHLDHSVKVAESDLVARLEQDMIGVGLGEMSALGLIKSWASDGWLNRVSDGAGPGAQNVCSLTEDARSALAFLRRLRREDTVATGGSIMAIEAGLKHVAGQLDDDPQRVKEEIEAQIAQLYERLDELADGRRPDPDLVNLEDQARLIAYQMEQVITDIVRYGSRQNEITTGLIDTDDSDVGFRDQSHQLFSQYGELFGSREKASYAEFTRLVQDPDKRARLRGDIAVVVEHLPELDVGLQDVMTNFFRLVSAQIADVSRIEQRCALRIKRFFAAGTAEQARGVARQLNEALVSGHALLRTSVVDSPLGVEIPVGRSGVSSIGAATFDIKDLRPPKAAAQAPSVVDVSRFAALASRVDMAALARLVNTAVAVGPVSLPEMIGMVDAPYLGDVVVLWALARKQDRAEVDGEGVQVRFKSIDGRDRAVSVPALVFSEPVAVVEGIEL